MVTRYKIVHPDELNHHGVKGMKWGIRNDRKPTSSGGGYKSSDKNTRNAKIKKAAKIGVAVAVTAAAVYGGYKLHQVRQSNKAAVGKYIMENGYFGKTKITGKSLKVQGFQNPNKKGFQKVVVKTYDTRKDSLSKSLLGPNIKVTEISKSFANKPVYTGQNTSGIKVASSSMSRDIGRHDPLRNKRLTKEQTKYYADYYNRYIKGR